MSLGSWFLSFLKKLLGIGNPPTEGVTEFSSNAIQKALCIGINNYPGTGSDLNGCVNDARDWSDFLKEKGYEVKRYLDRGATKLKVSRAIKDIVAKAKSGDSIVITYSGHGTFVKGDASGDEPDGKDEAWYLYDGIWTDDSIRSALSKLNSGVNLTIISDSCYSGTVTRAMARAQQETDSPKIKYMPPESDEDALALPLLPTKKKMFQAEESMNHVLITGCSDTEYSYDTSFNGKYNGAFSYFTLKILRVLGPCSYNEFYEELRKKLPSGSLPQTPQCEGPEEKKASTMFA